MMERVRTWPSAVIYSEGESKAFAGQSRLRILNVSCPSPRVAVCCSKTVCRVARRVTREETPQVGQEPSRDRQSTRLLLWCCLVLGLPHLPLLELCRAPVVEIWSQPS